MFRQLLIIAMCCIFFATAKSVKKSEADTGAETEEEVSNTSASSVDEACPAKESAVDEEGNTTEPSIEEATAGSRKKSLRKAAASPELRLSVDEASTGVGKAVFRRVAKGIDTEFVG